MSLKCIGFLVLLFGTAGFSAPAKESNLKRLIEAFEKQNDNPETEAYLPEENILNRNVFEGDIYVDKSTSDTLTQLMNPGRDALVNPVARWPDSRVPYVFGPVSSLVKRVFKEAIAEYKKHTCINIVPRTNERDYLYIVSEGGCWSAIGRSRYRQKLSIGQNCERKGIVMHELMHAIGFFHEQSRLDRDDYITVHWENIDSRRRYNFQKYDHGEADTLGASYDYGSIMHYPMYAFTSNGRATIVPKDANAEIGQRREFSKTDIKQINELYKCVGKTTIRTTPTPPLTKSVEICADKLSDNRCYFYSWFGFCRSYYDFMSSNCKYSCRFC